MSSPSSSSLTTTTTATTNNNNNTSSSSVVPVPLLSQHKQGGGALLATVLSAYDLPHKDPPACVSLRVAGQQQHVARTGPPSSRHKDRNSFRFLSKQTLRIEAPLRELYKETAVLTVEYANHNTATSNPMNYAARVELDTLPIQETTWLILHLEPCSNDNGETTTSSSATKDNTAVTADDDDTPTLRLQMRLEGPYRMEIGALVHLARQWFATVDSVQHHTRSVVPSLPAVPSAKILLLPAVPLAAAGVVLAPVAVGILLVGLPVVLPVVVAALAILSAVAALGGLVWASTPQGRSLVGGMTAPLLHTLLSTRAGQVLVYETGPRPTPVSVARAVLPTDLWGKLWVSLLVDLVGSASYLVPVVGEITDVAWAPVQTVLIMAMYDDVAPNLKYVSFVEEMLPLTDVVPSATIGWLSEFGPQLLPPALLGTTASTTTTAGGGVGVENVSAVKKVNAGLVKSGTATSSSSVPGVAQRS